MGRGHVCWKCGGTEVSCDSKSFVKTLLRQSTRVCFKPVSYRHVLAANGFVSSAGRHEWVRNGGLFPGVIADTRWRKRHATPTLGHLPRAIGFGPQGPALAGPSRPESHVCRVQRTADSLPLRWVLLQPMVSRALRPAIRSVNRSLSPFPRQRLIKYFLSFRSILACQADYIQYNFGKVERCASGAGSLANAYQRTT